MLVVRYNNRGRGIERGSMRESCADVSIEYLEDGDGHGNLHIA